MGVSLAEEKIKVILRETQGYPLAIAFAARKLMEGAEYDAQLTEEITQKIYFYYEEMVYRRFELPMRRFLMELAPFEEFNIELAKMISGDNMAGEFLSKIRENSNMLRVSGINTFCFWPIFCDFLIWEQNKVYTVEEQRALYSRGGLYYELHENYAKALECYSKSGEQSKGSELLIKKTRQHPGMGHYEDMEKYYLSLPDSIVKGSPALMQGKSMLCAMSADYEGSERWYNELKEFAAVRDKTDLAAREAKSRLVWLDVSLPQRGVSGLVETITAAFKLIANREVNLPQFSVTSMLPSIMNGGKDFSKWSLKDDFLYATMRLPVETVLGSDGIGLADCAIAESKFEKGEDVSGRMFELMSKISEVQSKGTPDIELAIVGLLARNQIDAGRAEDARRTVLSVKERFEQHDYVRFMPNINAMLCRIAIRLGDMEFADEWYQNEAPKDPVNVKTLKRYQYFTQAMAELARGDETAALLTLAPLEPYCRRCERYIDLIHLKVLTAIAKKRREDEAWKEEIGEALETAAKFGFVRTVGAYGAAVLPLLENCKPGGKEKFLHKVIKAARGQAVFYPDFLKPENRIFEKLTEAELQVLRLLCADKSNSQIGEILGIQLATVKSHVSHILQKLGVSRRSEAKTVAERFYII